MIERGPQSVSDSRWRWETRRQRGRRSVWRTRAARYGALVLIGAVAGVLLATGVLSVGPLFVIRDVGFTVAGPGTLDTDSLATALALPEGASFLDLDRDACRARLLALPRISEVSFEYEWFHRLRVRVTERRALALILCPDGQAYEVARDGCCIATRGRGLADLPLFSAVIDPDSLEPGGFVVEEGASALLDVLATVREDFPKLWDGLSEAHLRPDGSYELYWNDDPIVAWGWGRLSHQRLTAWSSIMGDLACSGTRDVVVDLRFRKQIIIRSPREQDPGGWANG